MDKRLLLVDGHSLANRAFYALPPFTASDGTPTGAVFGFLSMLLRFLSEKRPSHVAIAFDLPGPTFRHLKYAEYKAQRKPAPPEFSAQIPVLKEVLDVLKLPCIEMEGYEADDIIGTLASKWKQCGGSVTILSGDRDCLQLVDDAVTALLPVKGISQVKEYDPQRVREDLGVRPDQIRDYKALCGDASDNIPGVRGVGQKTATALLQKFDSLDKVYEGLEEVTPPRVRNLLVAGKDMAFLSKALATIDTSVPLDPCDLEDELAWRAPDLDEVKALFTKIEIRSLIPRVSALVADALSKDLPARDARPEDVGEVHQESCQQAFRESSNGFSKGSSQGPSQVSSQVSSQGSSQGSSQEPSAAMERSAQTESTDKEPEVSAVRRQGSLGITEPELVRPAETRTPPGLGESAERPLPHLDLDAGLFRQEVGLVIDDEVRLKALAEEVRSTGMLGIYAVVDEVTRTFSYPSAIGVSSGRSFGTIRVAQAQVLRGRPETKIAVDPSKGSMFSRESSRAVITASITETDQAEEGNRANPSVGLSGVSGAAPTGVMPTKGVTEDALWKHLGPLLVSPDVAKVGFDLKWVFTLCFKRGITLRGTFFDVLIAAYLLDPTRTNYRLEDLVRKYAAVEIPEMPQLKAMKHQAASMPGRGSEAAESRASGEGAERRASGEGAERRASGKETESSRTPADGEGGMADVGTSYDDRLAAHLSAGAHACLGIANACRAELEHAGLVSLAQDVEFPLIEVLAAMEATGIKPDLALGKTIRKSFADALRVLEDSIYAMAGEKFNLDSPKQLSRILFENLGLKPIKKTKTGWSTDAEVLEALSLEHELPAKILEYRQYAKLKSTYLDVLEEVTNPTTGRIHSTFHQTVTATGRLSCSEPNLQNIPVRGDLGRSLRRIFIPGEGRLLLSSDYSQIELRIMAHMSGDPTMIDAFTRGEDIHTRTASEIFGVPVDSVDYDLRSKAKAVNFGIIYGISDFGLARNTGVTIGEARTFIEAYFARYPRIREFMDRSIETARQYGYVTTILGRRRAIPDINSRIRARRGFAERTAINTPIQGSAADIIKLAMVRIYRRLKEEGLLSRLILQVHDELIFEIPPEEETTMRELVRREMEDVISLKVPLKVEIDVGKSWFDV